MLAKVTQIVLMVMMLAAPITEASAARREKRESTMLGGWQQVDVTDAEVRAAAAKAVDHLERARNSAMVYRLQEVTSAKFQIARGYNFELVLKIGQTDCFRHLKDNEHSCSVVEVERCVVTVRVWQNTSEITNSACGKEENVGGGGIKSRRMQMTGGEKDVDVNREDVIGAATYASRALSRLCAEQFRVRVVRIIKATVQIVSGSLYRMTIDFTVTSKASDKRRRIRCTVTVLHQPRQELPYSLEKHDCDV